MHWMVLKAMSGACPIRNAADTSELMGPDQTVGCEDRLELISSRAVAVGAHCSHHLR